MSDGIVENDLDPDAYVGIRYPLSIGATGVFNRTKTALEQSKSNIKHLLLTTKGERLGNPTFGTNLRGVLFEPEGTDLEANIEEEIRSSMSEFLPFINIEKIEIKFSDRNQTLVRVNLKFALDIDSTSSTDLSLDLGNYSGELATGETEIF